MNLPLYRFGIEEKMKKNNFEKLLSKHMMAQGQGNITTI